MPTIDRDRVALAALAAVVVTVAVVLLLNLGSPPQMGADEEVFRTVDALFTALTGRSGPQLDQCERRLRGHREAGKLPPKAAQSLDGIIATARAGGWRPAAERLYAFMKGQKRDGAGTPRKQERAKKGRTSSAPFGPAPLAVGHHVRPESAQAIRLDDAPRGI